MPAAAFTGLGGHAMGEAGQQQVVRAEDVAVMGITEILRHVPRIIRSYRQLVRSIRAARPDAAVLIDFPDVNFRLAKHLRRAGVPVVWFVSPQLWAWKRRRLRWVRQRVDRMLVIFPFEEPFYRARGVAAEFVGHPLAEPGPALRDRSDFAREYSLWPDATWIALLPGSRRKELAANLPEMLRAADRLDARDAGRYEFLLPVATTLSSEEVRRSLARARTGSARVTLVADARLAMAHAQASVVASGTATVLAAIVGNPFVVVYRVSPMTFQLARRLIRYPAEIPVEREPGDHLPIAMVNLIAGRRVVPELLNESFTAERILAELQPLLVPGAVRTRQMTALAGVRDSLLAPAGRSSIASVVDAVVDLLNRASGAA